MRVLRKRLPRPLNVKPKKPKKPARIRPRAVQIACVGGPFHGHKRPSTTAVSNCRIDNHKPRTLVFRVRDQVGHYEGHQWVPYTPRP